MHPLSGPFIGAMLLLAAAGVFKVIRPEHTVPALAAVSLPASTAAVRGLGLAEISLAGFALVAGGAWAAGAGAMYLAFAGFVLVALARAKPLRSCGCFGRADTPPSSIHIVVNLAAAVVALAVAADPAPLAGSASEVAPVVAAGLATSYVLYVLLAVYPQTRSATGLGARS